MPGQGASEFRMQLLETFELTVAGTAVALPAGSQRLLAFLAIARHPVRRDSLAFSLWTDKDEDHAYGNLRTALWRIRRAARGVVRADGERLGLTACEVDLYQVITAAESVLTGDGAAPAARRLLTSGGELLADWYDPWLIPERERLRQLRLHALEAICSAAVAVGDTAGAIDSGLAAVACEPLRESAHRALIVAHLAEGNTAEALRQYETYRSLLFSELAILPSTLMEDLVAPVRLCTTRRPG